MENRPVYRSAEALGIEQWEHDGLVALIGPLSRGELTLHMSPTVSNCGTAACIGGWVALRSGIKYFPVTEYVLSALGRQLEALYYPWNTKGFGATAPQAARAIVNFLTLGDPRWDDVMRGAS